MLRCRDVTELIGTDTLPLASLRQRVAVRLHMAICRHCRAYARSLRQLAESARRLARLEPAALSPRAEEAIQALKRSAAAWHDTPRDSD